MPVELPNVRKPADTLSAMSDELTTTVQLPFRVRMRLGVRHPGNWLQLLRFGAVGASGYVVNLVVFAVCVHLIGIDYRVSSAIAFLVSVNSNFWLNRHWTFSAREAHPMQQAIRFFTISVVVYGFSYVVLVALVDAGFSKVIAQAIAIAAGTPLSFVGQKLWSFKA
jgi:putative flippase GtrA